MSKDDERLKNFILYKAYATDEEMEDMMPFLVIIVVIVLVILAVIGFMKPSDKEAETVPQSTTVENME